MGVFRSLIRVLGLFSPRAGRPQIRTLDYDELTLLRQVALSQHLEIKALQQVTAEDISCGVEREFGRLAKFHERLRDGLKVDNDKLRSWLDAERERSSRCEQAVTKSGQENILLRANVRGLKADLKRSEEGRRMENKLHVKESKRASALYAREAAHWERIRESLAAKTNTEVTADNDRRAREETSIARAERDKYIGELEGRIASLTQTANESNRREASLDRGLNNLRNKLLAESNQVTDKALQVQELKTELDETKKALDDMTTSQSQVQTANESLITEKEELENAVSELTAESERDTKTLNERADKLAAKLSDQRMKASHDSAAEEGRRLRAEWHKDVQQVQTNWQTHSERERTSMQAEVQRAHDQWKTWATGAAAETTSIMDDLKTQIRDQTTRADNAVTLVGQLQLANTQLQDALKAAKQTMNQAATESNRADQHQADIQKVHDEWQAWKASAEAEVTNAMDELKKERQNETTRADDAGVLVDQLRQANTQLQNALNAANLAAATKSNSASQHQADVQRIHDQWKAWQVSAETKATSMMDDLKKQRSTEKTRADDAIVLVGQLRQANGQLQDTLNAANRAATESSSADQRIKELMQEVTQQNELLFELQDGDATDPWQAALGAILETNQVLRQEKTAVHEDGVTYPELQQIVMEATICEQDFDEVVRFIDQERWPHLYRHVQEAYYTMDLVMQTIKGSMSGAATAEVREKVLQILTRDRLNNLPENQGKDAAIEDIAIEDSAIEDTAIEDAEEEQL